MEFLITIKPVLHDTVQSDIVYIDMASHVTRTVADLNGEGARGTLAPPVQILSISRSFWGNLANSYVGAPPEGWRPHLGEILDPPLKGNCCSVSLKLILNSFFKNAELLKSMIHFEKSLLAIIAKFGVLIRE